MQADPIRAPARAQDLTLRHRVRDYRAGDLERRYAKLGIEEDFFINYGFVTSALQALMHPRPATNGRRPWSAARRRKAELLLEFVRERGAVHPREVDAHFDHGRVTTRDELLQKLWGRRETHRDRTVDVFVRRLRDKIDRRAPRHNFIHTRYGVGYKVEAIPK